MIREYIEKIVDNKKTEDMERLGDMLDEIICGMKENNRDLYDEYKMELYEMAYGKVLTREMAEKWVDNMKPKGKWDIETTSAVKRQYGLGNIDDISFYVVMNMLYSDMGDILGDGEDGNSIENYVNATKDWLNDEDIGKDKLYKYWKYVAN